MLEIDFKTLILFLIVGNLVAFFFFQFQLYFHHSKIPKLKNYVLARFLQTIAWLTNFIQLKETDHLYMIAITGCLAIGFAIEVYILITTNGEFDRKKFITLFVIAAIGVIGYTIVSRNVNLRVMVISFTWALLFGYSWINLSLLSTCTKLQQLAGWMGFLISILFLNRAIQTLLLETELRRYSMDYFNVLPGIGVFVITIAWPLVFILLHKERDEQELIRKDKLLLKNNQELKKMYASKDRFFQIISHDLRAPMASIIGFLYLINEDLKEKNYSKLELYTKPITQAANQSLNLLDDLLQYSFTQTTNKKFVFKELNLEALVDRVIKLFQLNFTEKELAVTKNIAPGLQVKANEFMLETVIRNLLSNAIKFTPKKGSIVIRASQQSDKMIIEVKDSGEGISQEDIKKLFRIESNFSSPGTNNEKGTGLGLILCKEFIQMHRGEINVESEPGKGSVFRISLPVSNGD